MVKYGSQVIYVDDMQAAKGKMAVCYEHLNLDCRYLVPTNIGKWGIHRRPIDPPSIFLIKDTSTVGTPAPKPRSTKKATASVRSDDAKIDPDKEWKELKERESINTSYLKIIFVALLNI